MNEIITYFKNTTNISRTSFDRDKSFQVNIVYRIQIETRVKQYNYVTKKILKNFFLVSRARILTASQTETIFFSLALFICYIIQYWTKSIKSYCRGIL